MFDKAPRSDPPVARVRLDVERIRGRSQGHERQGKISLVHRNIISLLSRYSNLKRVYNNSPSRSVEKR